MIFQFQEGSEPLLMGDVHFSFKHNGMMTDTQFCRISFNTAFINHTNTLVITKNTVSPDSVRKDTRFSDEFMIQFIFEDFCRKCNKAWEVELDDICADCKGVLKDTLTQWKTIKFVLDSYDYPCMEEGLKMHPGMEEALLNYKDKPMLYDSSKY